VLCLPIFKQTKLIGALYLENDLTPRAFTDELVTVLDTLASQAANSLQNALLYSDLQRSEAYLAQGQSISHTGSFGRDVVSGEIYWSEETYKIFELDRSVKPTMEFLFQRIHPDDRERVQEAIARATNEKADFDFEYLPLSLEAYFGATFFTDSTSFRSRFPHCANEGRTFPSWSSTLLIVTQEKQGRAFER
jgi:signal transduction protein with GAF and PtsI domain